MMPTPRPFLDVCVVSLRRTLLLGLAALMVACGLTASPAKAQTLPIAGTARDAWVVLPDAQDGLAILHRQATDPAHQFWQVTQVPGLLMPGGLAAGDATLWLVYRNGIVQSMRLAQDPMLPQMRFARATFHPALPAGSAVRSLAASPDTLWALLAVSQQAGLASLDQALAGPAASPPTQGASANPPPDPVSGRDTAATPQTTEATDATPVMLQTPVTRLARLHRGRWVDVPLPEDWPADARAWIAFVPAAQATPVLIAEVAQGQAGRLRVYRHDDRLGWQAHDHTAPTDGDLSFLNVQEQLVMARRDPASPALNVALWVLRPERAAAVPIGQLTLDAPADQPWGVATLGLSAALATQDDTRTLHLTAMDLLGQQSLPAGQLAIEQPPRFVQDPGQTLLVGVVAVSIFLMFVIWRRDPTRADIALPSNVTLADLGRRLAAVAVDLAPCVGIALVATGTPLSQLPHTWPGRGGSWEAMLPGAIAITLFVLHTGLSETFTGRTLGKALFGLRVVSADGQPPNIWQAMARNLLKAFDLIAFYILPIMMLISRHRQRLGDLVGKTLVVTATPQPPVPPQDDPDAPGQDDPPHQDNAS